MISDLTARKFASEWHGGQGSPLYALSSTGAIVRGVGEEIANAMYVNMDDEDNYAELSLLLDYVEFNGARGAQKGWGCLSW